MAARFHGQCTPGAPPWFARPSDLPGAGLSWHHPSRLITATPPGTVTSRILAVRTFPAAYGDCHPGRWSLNIGPNASRKKPSDYQHSVVRHGEASLPAPAADEVRPGPVSDVATAIVRGAVP